jgi:galactokinase
MNKKLIKNTTLHFENIFQKTPEYIFLSPGRINIIGEHIDYNDGFVLPAAINKYICFAISKNDNSECTIVAKDLNETYHFNWNEELKPIDKMWVNYILGVIASIERKRICISKASIWFLAAQSLWVLGCLRRQL